MAYLFAGCEHGTRHAHLDWAKDLKTSNMDLILTVGHLHYAGRRF
jgi:hypothetical protein